MRRAVLLALTLLAAGCGGGGADSASEETVSEPLPECAQTNVGGRNVARPAKLPAGFPLPPGMVITLVEDQDVGGLKVDGYAPGTVDSVGQFFERELPDAGYEIVAGDQEEFEKEADFLGNGSLGEFKIFGSPDCPTAVRVVVGLAQA
jgi:hypothetical protein